MSGERTEQPHEGLTDQRHESGDEKSDRNWLELLQELRVLQTGVQIIGGFLLTLPFQSKFSELDSAGRTLYLSLVVIAALATALTLMPVAVHRRLFRHHRKLAVVKTADLTEKVVLGALGLLIAGGLGLVFTLVLGDIAGWVSLGIFALFLMLLLIVVPFSFQRQSRTTLQRD
ncbi:DUF6328 family protein [Psychromicrobium lacuslunae]|uniref:Sodium:proton antiporter n=1 Tax=Psychromicrobium lacuslunae TaxID=1618207 RepID=A0A0D4C0K3_9MICC|nr:DUF6328 family protein [Psychromicrobium lacuslunae]AJT42202.1 hypothetical protein UM93_13075 [Psychromicrobium lacuslunae]